MRETPTRVAMSCMVTDLLVAAEVFLLTGLLMMYTCQIDVNWRTV